jgi:hypothetical protein
VGGVLSNTGGGLQKAPAQRADAFPAGKPLASRLRAPKTLGKPERDPPPPPKGGGGAASGPGAGFLQPGTAARRGWTSHHLHIPTGMSYPGIILASAISNTLISGFSRWLGVTRLGSY